MLQNYFIFALPVVILELIAAISGTFYRKKVPETSFKTKAFVVFLWFTFIIEFLSSYAAIGYFTNYEYFSFIEDTLFRKTNWIFNIYSLFTTPFLVLYFASFFKKHQVFFWIAAIGHFLIELGINLFSKAFFYAHLPQLEISSALLILITISMFFIKLSSTNLVLELKTYLPFYFAVGVLVFWLCTTPLLIFSKYFSSAAGNDLFLTLHMHVMLYANIFMYSCFIFGFLLCYKKKKSY